MAEYLKQWLRKKGPCIWSREILAKTSIPQRLKDHAQKYHAKPGWVFLTGHKSNVNKVLSGLGAYTPDFRNHSTKVMVGDGQSGRWTNVYGFASPEDILAKLNELEKARRSAQ